LTSNHYVNFNLILEGGGKVLQIFDPADAQQVYRNEGKFPNRGNVFSAFKLLRADRADLVSMLKKNFFSQ